MQKDLQNRDEQYEGPSKTIVAAGKGYALSWATGIAGAIAGAAISLFGSSESGYFTKKGAELLKVLGSKNPHGKWAVTVGGGLLGWGVGHYAGLIIGTKRAHETAGRGREQFERIKAERDAFAKKAKKLEGDVESLNQEIEVQHDRSSDAAAMETPHMETESADLPTEKVNFAAAHLAKQAMVDQQEPQIAR